MSYKQYALGPRWPLIYYIRVPTDGRMIFRILARILLLLLYNIVCVNIASP